MKHLAFFIFSILLLSGIFQLGIAQNKEIATSGVVLNQSGDPIGGACVIFSGNFLRSRVTPETKNNWVDTVLTGIDGEFLINILTSKFALGIQYTILKKGYKEKSGYGEIKTDKMTLGKIILERIELKKITVTGIVIDSSLNVFENPVANAMVILSAGKLVDTLNIMIGQFDTVFTDNKGQFTKIIEINNDIARVLYRVSKTGYITKTGFGLIDDNSNIVDMGKIFLSLEQVIKVLVKGRILENGDDIVFKPVADAMVLLSKYGLVIEPNYDTVFTDKLGKLSTYVIIKDGTGILPLQIAYIISKEGYARKSGTGKVVNDVADFGDILIDKLPVSIHHINSIKTTSITQKRIAIYSLKGQLLYEGSKINADLLRAKGVFNNQTLIITNKQNNKIINTKNIVF